MEFELSFFVPKTSISFKLYIDLGNDTDNAGITDAGETDLPGQNPGNDIWR